MKIEPTEQERQALVRMMAIDPWSCRKGTVDRFCPEEEMGKIVDENPTPLLRAMMSVYQDGRACPGPDIHFRVELALGIRHPKQKEYEKMIEQDIDDFVESVNLFAQRVDKTS